MAALFEAEVDLGVETDESDIDDILYELVFSLTLWSYTLHSIPPHHGIKRHRVPSRLFSPISSSDERR
jgi:hypothetical protein